jgi:arylsulfatase A
MISKNHFLYGAFLFTTALCAKNPNIIFLLADDLGLRDVGCYGGPIQTPAIDTIAEKGTRFTTFYSGSAVCSPSRATMLTGRQHIRTGIYSWVHEPSQKSHLLEREVTIPEVLKEQGYSTAHFGKWHLGLPYGKHKNKPTPDKHGFDYWFLTENNASPNHKNPYNFIRNGTPIGKTKGYSCRIVIDEALDWLQKRQIENQESPFFLNIWFHEPHKKMAAPDECISPYLTDGDTGVGKDSAALYSGTIDNTDRAIKELLHYLEEQNLMEDTLIVYSSDNGSFRSDRVGVLKGKKGSNYEGGLRVPGIFCWPAKIRSGIQIEEPAGLVDLMATICDFVGYKMPDEIHLDGSSLQSLLTGAPKNFKRLQPFFWHFAESKQIVGIRDGSYSLLAYPDYEFPKGEKFNEAWIPTIKEGGYRDFELYDLVNDPMQEDDLAKQRPELLLSLKNKLLKINASVMAEGSDWHLDSQ